MTVPPDSMDTRDAAATGPGDIAEAKELVAAIIERTDPDPERDRQALGRVLDHLTRLADREAAIDALHRTAADIIGAHQVDDVLEAAVQRTYRLIGSDLAYLSLFDEESRETYVKTSVGAHHASFNKLRVPYGSGVGGMVARLKGPFFTPDYLADIRLGHLPRVDQGIASEGIRAMLGVPLIVDDQFTGALFVADRRVRTYAREEIDHLMALGSLVALAIDSARLLEQRERGLRELKGAYDALRARNAATERVAALHDRMSEILARGGTPEELTATLAGSMAVEIRLVRIPSQAEPTRDGLAIFAPDRSRATALEASRRTGSCQEIATGEAEGERWLLALFNGTDSFGHLEIRSPQPLLGTDRRTLERAGHVLTLLLLGERDRLLRDSRDRRRFLTLLLAERRRPEAAARLAEAIGVDPHAPAVILCLGPGEEIAPQALAAAWDAAVPFGGCVGEHDGALFILLPGGIADGLTAVHDRLSAASGRRVTLGFAACADPLRDAIAAAGDARRCCELLLALGRAGEMADWRQFGALSLLLKGNTRQDLSAFVDHVLGPVLTYDAEHATALAATLRAYLDNGRNATETANRLGIHPKTMLQRLDRLGRLLGSDWLSADRALQLHFALRLQGWLD